MQHDYPPQDPEHRFHLNLHEVPEIEPSPELAVTAAAWEYAGRPLGKPLVL